MSTLVNGINKEQTQWILSLVVRPERTDTQRENTREVRQTETDWPSAHSRERPGWLRWNLTVIHYPRSITVSYVHTQCTVKHVTNVTGAPWATNIHSTQDCIYFNTLSQSSVTSVKNRFRHTFSLSSVSGLFRGTVVSVLWVYLLVSHWSLMGECWK